MTLPDTETLLFDLADNGVLTLTLDRPEKKNAANAQMWDELLVSFQSVKHDTSIRALVVTGSGDAFCSGADLGGTEAVPSGINWPRCATSTMSPWACTSCPCPRLPR